MAFDPNQQDPNAQNPVNQPQVQPMTSSAPGGGPSSPGVGKGGTPQSTPAQPFQNLNAYLTANAPQVNQQASQIAGNLGTQYGQVTSDINKGASEFSNQVMSGYASPNSDTTTAAANDPAKFASDPNNVKAFQSLYNDTYNGPSNFESTAPYGALNAEATKAASDAALLGTTAGTENYFQSKNPNATQGGNTLDAVLLQGNPDANATISNAVKPFSTLADQLAGTVTTADAAVPVAQKAAADTAAATQNQFTGTGGVIPSFESDLAARVAANQGNVQTQATTAKNDLTSWLSGSGQPVTDQDLSTLGLKRSDIVGLMNTEGELSKDYSANFDVSPYFKNTLNPQAEITNSNFATPADYSKAAALSALTGQDLSSFLNPANASQAGTAPTSIYAPGSIGKAQTDAASLLSANDQKILDQYQIIPNATTAATLSLLRDVFGRNIDKLNPAQKAWLDGEPSSGSTGFGNGTNGVF